MTDRSFSRILSVRRLLCIMLVLGWSERSSAQVMPAAARSPPAPVATTAGIDGAKAAGISPTPAPPPAPVSSQSAPQPGTPPAPPAAAVDETPPEIAGDRADAIAHDVVLHPPQKQIAPQDAAHLRTAKLKLGGLLDRSVHGTENTEVGRVIDVMVGEDGRPAALELDVGGFMGVGNRKIAVAWGLFDVSKPGNEPLRVMLTEAQVKSAPEVEAPEDMTVVTGVDATVPAAAAVMPIPPRPPASAPAPPVVPATTGAAGDRSRAPVDPPAGRPGTPDPEAAARPVQAEPAPANTTIPPDLEAGHRHGEPRRPAAMRPADTSSIPATAPASPVDAPAQPSGDGAPDASVDEPSRPSVGRPPKPLVGRPPKPLVGGPSRPPVDGPQEPPVDGPQGPSVDGPQEPPVDGPQKPSVDGPRQPSSDGRP